MIFGSLALHLLLSYSATLMKLVSTDVVTETNAGQSNENIFKHNVEFYQPAHLSCSHPRSTQVQAWILPTGEIIKYPFKGHYSERVTIFDHGQLLSVRKTDIVDFGLYICIVLVGNRGLVTIKHGVNVDGPYYDPKQAEKYRRNAIIGGIAAGIMLVVSSVLWIISDNCRKGREKGKSTVHTSLEGDPEPGLNCGQDCEEIVTGVGITDGGRTSEDLAGMYETVEERTINQYASAKATSDNTEIVHEMIVSAGYSTVETVSENRSNAQELDLTSWKQPDLQSETTAEDEVVVEEDKQDKSGNNTNFQGETTGNNEEVIHPAVILLEDNGVLEMDDFISISSPLESEPDLEEKKDQLILFKESNVLNNPTDPVTMKSLGVDERDDIQGLLNLEHTEVEMKEKSKGPSSRHGSDHKENVIIQDGKIIVQKNAESTEDKIKETTGNQNITSDIFVNREEMNVAKDKTDGGDINLLSVSMANENLETNTATLEPSGLNELFIPDRPLKFAPAHTDEKGYIELVAGAEIPNVQTTE